MQLSVAGSAAIGVLRQPLQLSREYTSGGSHGNCKSTYRVNASWPALARARFISARLRSTIKFSCLKLRGNERIWMRDFSRCYENENVRRVLALAAAIDSANGERHSRTSSRILRTAGEHLRFGWHNLLCTPRASLSSHRRVPELCTSSTARPRRAVADEVEV